MNELPTPTLTAVARRWLDLEVPQLDRTRRALLSTVDGRRNVIQLESVARAMGLPDRTLEDMRERGLLVWSTLESTPSSQTWRALETATVHAFASTDSRRKTGTARADQDRRSTARSWRDE
jgi:hypothetical protein